MCLRKIGRKKEEKSEGERIRLKARVTGREREEIKKK